MNPIIWGPDAWSIIHTFAAGFNNSSKYNKTNITNFFKYFAEVLPCEECKKHFKVLLQKYPITSNGILESPQNLLKWTVFLHNKVNERLGKSVVDFNVVRNKYESHKMKCVIFKNENTCQTSNYNIKSIILIIIIICISLYLIYINIRYNLIH